MDYKVDRWNRKILQELEPKIKSQENKSDGFQESGGSFKRLNGGTWSGKSRK
jgi:hypothetical protein